MDGDVALDTNVVALFFDGVSAVTERILAADRIFLPSTVLGELFYGAMSSTRVAENIVRIEAVLGWVSLIPVDRSVADAYGAIKQQLRADGRMIPDNEIWIAAAARICGATLASRDKHFQAVRGLQWERW